MIYLDPGSHQAHINAPKQSYKAEEDDPALNGDEAKADDGSERPDLVTGDDDGDRLGADVVRDDGGGLSLQHAHEDEEGDRVEDGAKRNAVDEPLRKGVLKIKLGLRPGPGTGFGLLRRRLLLQVTRAVAAGAGAGALVLALVGRKRALEQLLPQVVGRRRQEGHGHEAQEYARVEDERSLVAVRLENLSEDVRRAR